MDVETIKVLAILLVVFFGASVIIFVVDMLTHLIRAPRCPHCKDWLDIQHPRRNGGVLYKCPGCESKVWDHELEAHRERQSTRNG